MRGWIRVERKVFKDDFFKREPMSEREAWLWMLAKAAWEDTTHRVGGDVLPVPRGSFMATLREMQSVFGWRSDAKVRNFLKRLEAERMVERTTRGPKNAPKTHVTICNYDEYQSPERTENAPKTHRERTDERTKETNINNKQLDVDDSAGARDDFSPRETLLEAMGLPPDGVTATGKIHGNQNDMFEAGRWSQDLGLSLQEQVSVIRDVMRQKGGQPPNAFKYFTGAMSEAAGRKAQPKLAPTIPADNGVTPFPRIHAQV